MGDFFGRIARVFKGKAHEGIDALEDATFQTTLKQTVRDMEAELSKVIRASAEAMSNHNRLEAEHDKQQRASADWKAKATKALRAGNEALARKALAKKTEADRQVAAMASGVEQARQVRDKLKAQVAQLRGRIAEAKRTSSTLIARKNAAQAQKKVAQALSGAGEADNAFAAIASFEDSVEREEALAKAYDDMSVDTNADLEKEFEQLEDVNVDDELAALKSELAG